MGSQSTTPEGNTDDRAFFEGLLPKGNPYRRLLAAILLRAALDAHRGERGAWSFLQSKEAALMADELNIRHWPPTRDMLASHSELQRRSTEIHAVQLVA